jgi:Putative Flp pilus-assembly TadE/G-like
MKSNSRNTRRNSRRRRDGVVLVLIVVSLVALFTFVALAVDLGMLAVARTQAQDAADSAAMAGARTLNGVSSNSNNYAAATPTAVQAATGNSILSAPVPSSAVNVQIGRYAYVTANQRFEGQFPGPSTDNWSLAQATITTNIGNQLPFAKVFSFGGVNLQATATAAHRPRDVAIILDYSGSMRFASLAGLSASSSSPYSGVRTRSNNPDSAFPTFGHYSAGAALQATSFTSPYEQANITATTNDNRGPIVADFYTDTSGTAAFTAAANSFATTPGGDNYLKVNNNAGPAWCSTAANLVPIAATNSTPKQAFETNGYTGISGVASFSGYTQGPNYWGKTFFIWPPDPAVVNGVPRDWRQKYFTYAAGKVPADLNSLLWDNSGNWQVPGNNTYHVDYTAILSFIKSAPNPFPNRLQSGRILYYDQIPDSISATYPPADLNERFWKDYIDYVLGIAQTGSSSWSNITAYTGYGDDYTFGTVKITPKASLTGNPLPYMHYADNPKRPRTHFWFGPLTMVDFLGNYNLWNVSGINPSNTRYCAWPGTCHESPMYACKLGIRSALSDISTNHPNDLVSLMMFSSPQATAGDGGRFNRVRVGLSRNYTDMQDALWYPASTIGNSGATIRPYDADNLEVPRAMGGTCYSMGLMLAYNQFSANSSLLTYNPGATAGDAGGNGRKGAQKIIIIETDGSPNVTASATLNNLGSYQSYYSIRYNSSNPSSSQFPNVNNGASVTTEIYNLCTQLCALDTASPPGYSSANKKALIHCIGFGPEFAPSGPNRAANLAILNQIQQNGNVADGMPSYKIIYGTESAITASLQQAMTQILQSGVQVSLIQ